MGSARVTETVPTERRTAAELYAVSAALLWGTSIPAIGILLRDLEPLSIALWRGVLQTVVLAIVIFVARRLTSRSRGRPLDGGGVIALVVLAVTGGFFNIGQAVSVALAGPAAAAFVAGLYPVAAVAMAPLALGEPMRRSTFVGLLLSVLGVAFLLDPLGETASSPLGIAVAAVSAISFGMFLVLARRFVRDYGLAPATPSLALLIGLTAMALPSVLIAEGTAGLALDVGTTGAEALAWLVLVSGVVPLVLSEAAVRLLPTRRTSPYMFLAPIVGTGLAVPLLGITIAPTEFLGGGLAVAGILVATWPVAPANPS